MRQTITSMTAGKILLAKTNRFFHKKFSRFIPKVYIVCALLATQYAHCHKEYYSPRGQAVSTSHVRLPQHVVDNTGQCCVGFLARRDLDEISKFGPGLLYQIPRKGRRGSTSSLCMLTGTASVRAAGGHASHAPLFLINQPVFQSNNMRQ